MRHLARSVGCVVMALRLDRSVTLYVFGPLSRLTRPRGPRIPILMYHSISEDAETGHPYYWINTSPARFAEHMKFLHDNNYNVVSLSKAIELIRGQGSTTTGVPQGGEQKYVVLTFDDGYRDFHAHAFPVLRQYGYTATVFLPTTYIDGKRPGLRNKEHLGWDEVRELYRAGISFGSHTVTHPQLYGLQWDRIESELSQSKAVIESQLSPSSSRADCLNVQLDPRQDCSPLQRFLNAHHPAARLPDHPVLVDSFCYPYRFPEHDKAFVSVLQNLAEQAGYCCGVSTRVGATNRNDDLYSLRRVPVNSADDIALFSEKLAGHYDWVSFPQHALKRIRNS